MKVLEGAYPALPKPPTPKKRKCDEFETRTSSNNGLSKGLITSRTLASERGEKTPKTAKDPRTEKDNTEIKPELKVLPVGLDLGATFTGVAYASSILSEPSDVQLLFDYPGGASVNQHQVKVRSIVATPDQNEGNKKVKSILWGYQVLPGMTSSSLFKLKFDQSARPSKFDDPFLKAAEALINIPPGKTAQTVAEDFLRCLYAHVMKALDSVFTEEMMSVTRILWVLTVPAFWSNQAKELTLQAARNAGITNTKYRRLDRIIVVTEPEAAALSVLSASHGPFKFQPNTCILIADGGGYTVDLAVYKILQLQPDLKLEEAAVGMGAKCGSTAINRAVHDWMETRFGNAFKCLPVEKIGDGSKFMNEVEREKQDFDGTDLDDKIRLSLRMPDLQQNDIFEKHYDFEENDVLLPRSDFKKMFQTLINKILGLITEQLAAVKKEKMPPVKTIVLVGGFSNSKLLYNAVLNFCQGRKKLQCIRPDNGWGAIAKGAAIKGLKKSWISSVMGRQWLGITVLRPFLPGTDQDQDAIVHPFLGKRTRVPRWIVKKGEKLKPNSRRLIEVSFLLGKNDTGIWKCNLYSSTADIAPERVGDSAIDLEAEIEVDVSGISSVYGPNAPKQRVAGSDEVFTVVNVEVRMTLGSDEGTIRVTAMANGTRCGLVSIRYSQGGPLDNDNDDEEPEDEDDSS